MDDAVLADEPFAFACFAFAFSDDGRIAGASGRPSPRLP